MIIPKKKRCPRCNSKVYENTMRSVNNIGVCVECYVRSVISKGKKRKPQSRHVSRKEVPVIKYGTAEKVQKKDGKAVISKKELSSSEVAIAVKDTKTASPKKRDEKNVVVTDADYRQE